MLTNTHVDVVKNYIKLKYANIVRLSGEPLVNHSLEMAKILKTAGFDIDFQIVALLHAIIEDTNTTKEDLAHDLPFITFAMLNGVVALTKTANMSLDTSIMNAGNNHYGRVIEGVDRYQKAKTMNKDKNTPESISSFIFATLKYYMTPLINANNIFLPVLLSQIERLYSYCSQDAKIWLDRNLKCDTAGLIYTYRSRYVVTKKR